jgi:hypothetical protein
VRTVENLLLKTKMPSEESGSPSVASARSCRKKPLLPEGSRVSWDRALDLADVHDVDVRVGGRGEDETGGADDDRACGRRREPGSPSEGTHRKAPMLSYGASARGREA